MANRGVRLDVERDLVEIRKLIEQYIDTTYVKNIEIEMHRCRSECAAYPTREVELLAAFLPYVPEHKKTAYESILRVLTYEQVINHMMPMFGNSGYRNLSERQTQTRDIIVKGLLCALMIRMEKNEWK